MNQQKTVVKADIVLVGEAMDDYSHSYAMFYENGHGWPSSRSWIKPKTVQAVMPTGPWGNNIVGIYTHAIMTGSQLTFIFFRGVETTNQMTTYLLKWTNSPPSTGFASSLR